MCVIKRNLKFKHYKNYLETNQLDNEINHQEKDEIEVDNLKKDHKEFKKCNIKNATEI